MRLTPRAAAPARGPAFRSRRGGEHDGLGQDGLAPRLTRSQPIWRGAGIIILLIRISFSLIYQCFFTSNKFIKLL